MKLLNKASLLFFITVIPIIVGSYFVFVFAILKINVSHIDQNLKEEKLHFEKQLNTTDLLFKEHIFKEDHFELYPIEKNDKFKEGIFNLEIYDSLEMEFEPYRELNAKILVHNVPYALVLKEALIEDSTIYFSAAIACVVFILLVILPAFLMNRYVMSNMWHPFYASLKNLKNFDPKKEQLIEFEESKIFEFQELNESLTKMIKKIHQDFHAQKGLFDIISHEIQTPLAVIRNQIENMFQSQNLKEEEHEALGKINQMISRISRLSQNTLLLSRIENGQFSDAGSVDVKSRLNFFLEEFGPMLLDKEIHVEVNHPQLPVEKYMNSFLFDVLIRNTLQNAIRHNVHNGTLYIEYSNYSYKIVNSGLEPSEKTEDLFKKFKKSGNSSQSIGLGLSLVKSICDRYEFTIYYDYQTDAKKHCVKIIW